MALDTYGWRMSCARKQQPSATSPWELQVASGSVVNDMLRDISEIQKRGSE
jgi:hypothetical protein